MFCPKCSQRQPEEALRFCARCGFRLDSVKEMVAREGAREEAPAGAPGRGLRQKDMSLGAGLVFAGGVVSILRGMMEPQWPAEIVLPQAYLILGFTLAFVLTLFHPFASALRRHFSDESGAEGEAAERGRRDGVNLGALLMFLGTLKAMLLASQAAPPHDKGPAALIFASVFFVALLLLSRMLGLVYRLFFKESARARGEAGPTTTNVLAAEQREAALPPAQSTPAAAYAPPRADTAGLVMARPPSVTEDTTRKL